LPGDGEILARRIDTLMSFVWLVDNEMEKTLASAQRALIQVPPSHTFVFGYVHLTWALAAYSLGHGQKTVQFLNSQLKEYGNHSIQFTSRIMETLECLYLYEGHLSLLLELSQRRLLLANNASLPIDIGWSHLFLGMVQYEWNELEEAQQHFLFEPFSLSELGFSGESGGEFAIIY
jgi:hypothetical protein